MAWDCSIRGGGREEEGGGRDEGCTGTGCSEISEGGCC